MKYFAMFSLDQPVPGIQAALIDLCLFPDSHKVHQEVWKMQWHTSNPLIQQSMLCGLLLQTIPVILLFQMD